MAISHVASTTATAASGTTLTLNKPTGIVAGDLLIAILYVQCANQTILTPPAGWVSKGDNTGESSITKAQVWTKIAGGSEPASYDWTSSLTIVTGSGSITAYSADAAIVEGDSVFSALDSSAPVDAPSVTTVRPNAKLFCGYIIIDLGTSVTGMTNRVALDNGNRDIASFDEDIPTPGATGIRTYTDASTGWGYSLSIEEDGANRIRMMI